MSNKTSISEFTYSGAPCMLADQQKSKQVRRLDYNIYIEILLDSSHQNLRKSKIKVLKAKGNFRDPLEKQNPGGRQDSGGGARIGETLPSSAAENCPL